jgi:hypothetical protein
LARDSSWRKQLALGTAGVHGRFVLNVRFHGRLTVYLINWGVGSRMTVFMVSFGYGAMCKKYPITFIGLRDTEVHVPYNIQYLVHWMRMALKIVMMRKMMLRIMLVIYQGIS